MKRLILILAIGLALTQGAQAGPGGCTTAPSLEPFAEEVLVVADTALPLTASVYAPTGASPADMAIITIETDSVRWRDTGQVPTSAVGHLEVVTSSAPKNLTICGIAAIRKFQVIRSTAVSAGLTATYYREGS